MDEAPRDRDVLLLVQWGNGVRVWAVGEYFDKIGWMVVQPTGYERCDPLAWCELPPPQ